MKSLHYKSILLLLVGLCIQLHVQAQTGLDDVKAKLQDPKLERLYSKTYYSLIDRMDGDGYLPESLTGAYAGMYPRTTGALVLLFIETERYEEAELNIKYVLDAVVANGLERIPHVLERGSKIHSDEHQIDGQAHVILAWARLAQKRGFTAFEDETWPLVSKLMARTCDRTFFQYGGWSIEPGLIKNIAFEHSRDFRRWDCWDLLTQSFVGSALTEMMKAADHYKAPKLKSDWENKRNILSKGISDHLVVVRDGKPTFAEMLVPNGNGGTTYKGMGWVNFSPIAAGWSIDPQIMKNTMEYMEKHYLQTTDGIKWMPTDIFPDETFINEVIGKGIGWELDFARSQSNYDRVLEILDLVKASNKHSIYMEFSWLEGNGYKHNQRITKDDVAEMTDVVWNSRDVGNGEQNSWWCWAMARVRKSVGLPAEPARIETPENLITVYPKNGWGKRIANIYASSGWDNDTENAYNLLLGQDDVFSRGDKWFSTNNANPWVVIALTDYYKIEKIEFRDGRWYEKETGVTNLDEYKVYVSTTGLNDADWVEIISETGVANLDVKTKTLDTPVEARYIKFATKGGGDTGKKIWLYGIDVYGTLSREIDRGELISVGKTISAAHGNNSIRETPGNLLDGLLDNLWASFKDGDGKSAWVIVDLEKEYDVNKFVVVDNQDWINGYSVFVSTEKLDANSEAWIPAVSDAKFTKTEVRKESKLSASVKARYVKLEIPAANQFGWTRIKEFEIYGKK